MKKIKIVALSLIVALTFNLGVFAVPFSISELQLLDDHVRDPIAAADFGNEEVPTRASCPLLKTYKKL